MNHNQTSLHRRIARVRNKVRGTTDRPRLTVQRSNKHIYAQIIDDQLGKTLVATSDIGVKKGKTREKKIEAAGKMGKLVADKAIKAKVKQVRFDRGRYAYHGRVQAVAEAARQAGLKF